MKRRVWKTLLTLVLIAIMVLPTIRAAHAAGFNYYTGIFVYKNPDKMEYEVGDSFDPTGMVIHGYCLQTDGTTTINSLGLSSLTYSPTEFTKEGYTTVTLTLKCMGKSGQMEPFSTTLTVKVNEIEGDPPLYWTKAIEVSPSKVDYVVGESVTKGDFTAWAISEGNYPPEDAKWDCTAWVTKIEPSKFTKTGEQYVTVTANLTTEHSTADFTAKYKVTVHDKIKITKDPKGETVEEGGSCSFTVKGENYDYLNWYFTKGKEVVLGKFIGEKFPTLKVSGIYDTKLKLSNIPLEMDGWSVYCEFLSDAEAVDSKTALITVLPKETPTPEASTTPETTPETTPVSSETPAPETTADPVGEASVEPSTEPTDPIAGPHTHVFDGVYRYDGKQHWLECECGERTAVADHIVTEWKTVTPATKDAAGVRKGVCAVCGAEITETVPYQPVSEDGGNSLSWLLIAAIVMGAIALLVLIGTCVYMVMKRKKEPEE